MQKNQNGTITDGTITPDQHVAQASNHKMAKVVYLGDQTCDHIMTNPDIEG